MEPLVFPLSIYEDRCSAVVCLSFQDSSASLAEIIWHVGISAVGIHAWSLNHQIRHTHFTDYTSTDYFPPIVPVSMFSIQHMSTPDRHGCPLCSPVWQVFKSVMNAYLMWAEAGPTAPVSSAYSPLWWPGSQLHPLNHRSPQSLRTWTSNSEIALRAIPVVIVRAGVQGMFKLKDPPGVKNEVIWSANLASSFYVLWRNGYALTFESVRAGSEVFGVFWVLQREVGM